MLLVTNYLTKAVNCSSPNSCKNPTMAQVIYFEDYISQLIIITCHNFRRLGSRLAKGSNFEPNTVI